MSEASNKPLWPWIVALLIALPVLYVASFGPACWLASRGYIQKTTVQHAYWPIVYTSGIGHGPKRLRQAIRWWGSLGIPSGKSVMFIWYEPRPFSRFPGRNMIVFRSDGRVM